MTVALGDSICDIISNAKTVNAEILGYKDTTFQTVDIKKLLPTILVLALHQNGS